jgi:hypothetical protein
MKTKIGLLLCWLITQTALSQMHNTQTRNCINIDLGTDKFKQPQTSITFRTAIQNHVIYSLQLKSLNTYYLISKQQHIIKPQAEFYYHPTLSRYTFLFGIGTSINLLNSNSSSQLRKSDLIEPFISSTFIGSFKCFRYQLPVQLFASDIHSGIRFYPEIAYRYNSNSSLYIRSECILDNYVIEKPSEFYQQVVFGIQKMF